MTKQQKLDKKQLIQAKILDKISVATVWGQDGTQLYIGNIIYETIEEKEKEMSDKLDLAIAQCHGGGNGRRLLIQLKQNLK